MNVSEYYQQRVHASGLKDNFDQLSNTWEGKKVEINQITSWRYTDLLKKLISGGSRYIQFVSSKFSLDDMNELHRQAGVIAHEVNEVSKDLENLIDPEEAARYYASQGENRLSKSIWKVASIFSRAEANVTEEAIEFSNKLNQEVPVGKLREEISERFEYLEEMVLIDKQKRQSAALYSNPTPYGAVPGPEANQGAFYHEQQRRIFSGTCGIHSLNAFVGGPEYDELSIAQANVVEAGNLGGSLASFKEYDELGLNPQADNNPSFIFNTLQANNITKDDGTPLEHGVGVDITALDQKWENTNRVIICNVTDGHFTCARRNPNDGRWHFIDSTKKIQPTYNSLADLLNTELPGRGNVDLIG